MITYVNLSESSLTYFKRRARQRFPQVKSGHLFEAIACAHGFRTYASLRAAMTRDPDGIYPIRWSEFLRRLSEFGYDVDKQRRLYFVVPDDASTIRLPDGRDLLLRIQGLRRKLSSDN